MKTKKLTPSEQKKSEKEISKILKPFFDRLAKIKMERKKAKKQASEAKKELRVIVNKIVYHRKKGKYKNIIDSTETIKRLRFNYLILKSLFPQAFKDAEY